MSVREMSDDNGGGKIPAVTATSEEDRPLLQGYERLSSAEVQIQADLADVVSREMESIWEEECAKYEETIAVIIDGKSRKVPRRNYANQKGEVTDPTLYPYHTSCYPLLDAYDHLYDGPGQKQPIEALAVQPCPVPLDVRQDTLDRGNFNLQGYLPSSLHCIIETMVQNNVDWPVLEEFPQVLRLLQESQFHNNKYMGNKIPDDGDEYESFFSYTALEDIEFPSLALDEDDDEDAMSLMSRFVRNKKYGPGHLPTERKERAALLLNLLRHSMSELQRDHTLATAVIVRLMRHHDLDDVTILRQLLAILCAEYVVCDMEGEDEPGDHFCGTWQLFIQRLPLVLAFGITFMTREHATAIAGFVRATYFREFGYVLDDPESSDVKQKGKSLMKRNLLSLRGEDDVVAFGRTGTTSVPVDLVLGITMALGVRAAIDRRRLVSLLEVYSGSMVMDSRGIAESLDSYYNCLSALVDIGEASVLILPCNARFFRQASCLVRSLCRALVETGANFLEDDLVETGVYSEQHNTFYLAHAQMELFESRLSSPLRFTAGISEATSKFQSFPKATISHTNEFDQFMNTVAIAVNARPHNDIRDAVRGLFVRNMVDVRFSGLGYGDFMLWCRFEVTPLDPVLFWKYCMYPLEELPSDDEEDDDDEDEESVDWDVDEEDHLLSTEENRARVDFTILAMVRAWNKPWSPESHMSYQPPFRQAIETVALCTHRLGMPNELVRHIGEFMHRDWWDDERKECFDYDCQAEQVTKNMKRKFAAAQAGKLPPPGPGACVSCPGCHQTHYCTKEHRESDYKEGHKNECGTVPFCPPSKEEVDLFAALFGEKGAPELPAATLAHSEDADDVVDMDMDADDEGSWESMDSDEEEELDNGEIQPTKTRLICQFFKKEVYNKRKH